MRLIPQDSKFFELFAELSGYLTDGAKLLRSILEDPRDLHMRVEQVLVCIGPSFLQPMPPSPPEPTLAVGAS